MGSCQLCSPGRSPEVYYSAWLYTPSPLSPPPPPPPPPQLPPTS